MEIFDGRRIIDVRCVLHPGSFVNWKPRKLPSGDIINTYCCGECGKEIHCATRSYENGLTDSGNIIYKHPKGGGDG